MRTLRTLHALALHASTCKSFVVSTLYAQLLVMSTSYPHTSYALYIIRSRAIHYVHPLGVPTTLCTFTLHETGSYAKILRASLTLSPF